jgi:hypothetical protein
MDKKIKKIQREVKKEEKDLSSLLKADKKRDKIVKLGEKAKKKGMK